MKNIKVLWNNGKNKGAVAASYCSDVSPKSFNTDCLVITLEGESLQYGAKSTIVNIWAERDPFSFLARDVNKLSPIYIPEFEVVVTEGEDKRDYASIVTAIKAGAGKTKKAITEEEPEFSYKRAAAETRDLPGPAWLGISKDMRFFEVGLRTKACGNDAETYDYIKPRFFTSTWTRDNDPDLYDGREMAPEMNGRELRYSMMTGRGLGCRHQVTRCLEEGYMPILNAVNEDDGIRYTMQYFATQEVNPLRADTIRGTDMFAADAFGCGNMLTGKSREYAKSILESEILREEETVMYVRVVAENTTKAPAYSFVYMPNPVPGREYDKKAPDIRYNSEKGYVYSPVTGRVMLMAKLEGNPCPQEEMAVLLQPGEKINYEFKIPHRPISPERAEALQAQCYDSRLREAKDFWANELKDAAKIKLPEKRIEEMVKAGLLHIDVGYFGKNPDGAVVPIVGVYTAIGSESSPGIQFLDAVGMHKLAERSLDYFVNKQHESGLMMNFGGYMLETGSVLWSMGEHYRMTRDEEWVKRIHGNVIAAADYIIRWREDNLGDELKGGEGYGMIRGKVADPNDMFHSFMLNAGAYGGLAGASELLENVDPENAARIGNIAKEMRENIRESLSHNLAKSPVLPAGDGTWYRSNAPWTEYPGPVGIYSEGGKWYSHATFTIRDLISTCYLLLQGVVDPKEPLGAEIMKYYSEYLTINNTAFSQSYYSPHPYGNIVRGEVKPYIKEFYSGFASLADRETYSFWEHYHHASQHKLHEETWFLMRVRWMLALEDYKNSVLRLCAAVPRAWLEDGKVIDVDGMVTYFGRLSFKVESLVGVGRIKAQVKCGSENFPAVKTLKIRLPHPCETVKAKYSTVGTYCSLDETVTIENFSGCAEFELVF
ncbi:MAG: hypothetical protein GX633_08230 [Clostridiales bacterium]|nr:hypothetical protein [Clostridiales bacterium]